MNLRLQLASVIKAVRKRQGRSQEDFSLVSSRTYLSSLERGLKSPTIDKLVEIAGVLNVHPASLVILAECANLTSNSGIDQIDQIANEAKSLVSLCLNEVG